METEESSQIMVKTEKDKPAKKSTTKKGKSKETKVKVEKDESSKKVKKGVKKEHKESPPKKPEEPEKRCKRGFKFCKNTECDEMVHIHKKVCPKCGFEFEKKSQAKDEDVDADELDKLIKKKKKVKRVVAEVEEPDVPDMRIIKKAFYRNCYTINYEKLSKNIQNLKDRVFSELDMADKVI